MNDFGIGLLILLVAVAVLAAVVMGIINGEWKT